jgi:hypothetical protein
LPTARSSEERLTRLLIVALAVYWLALGLLMVAAPHTFFKQIGPFGAYNRHYVRDNASFSLAFGIALLVSVRMPAWRVPVIGVTVIQGLLHTINHFVDISHAHPKRYGPGDAIGVGLLTLFSYWVMRRAARGDSAP